MRRAGRHKVGPCNRSATSQRVDRSGAVTQTRHSSSPGKRYLGRVTQTGPLIGSSPYLHPTHMKGFTRARSAGLVIPSPRASGFQQRSRQQSMYHRWAASPLGIVLELVPRTSCLARVDRLQLLYTCAVTTLEYRWPHMADQVATTHKATRQSIETLRGENKMSPFKFVGMLEATWSDPWTQQQLSIHGPKSHDLRARLLPTISFSNLVTSFALTTRSWIPITHCQSDEDYLLYGLYFTVSFNLV